MSRRALHAGVVAVGLLSLGAAELLQGVSYRAVTLEPGQRRQFRVPGLERVTAASGRCVEEGLELDEPETFWLEASCSGVRTTLAWKKDGARVLVMACAEDTDRTSTQVKLRQRLQGELKGLKTVTACVRKAHVELWGWVETTADQQRVRAAAARFPDQVNDHVEVLSDER